jgi:hypothetical protein
MESCELPELSSTQRVSTSTSVGTSLKESLIRNGRVERFGLRNALLWMAMESEEDVDSGDDRKMKIGQPQEQIEGMSKRMGELAPTKEKVRKSVN